MDKSRVIEVLSDTLKMCADKIEQKGIYYHHTDDRLSHLRATAMASSLTIERSIHSLMSKHFTALPNMLDNQDNFSMAQFDEYIIDILVYTVYLRCALLESKVIEGSNSVVASARPLTGQLLGARS